MAVVVVAAGALIWIFGRRADRLRVARFAERPVLSVERRWEKFYRDRGVSAEAVARALNLIEDALGIPSGKLRPDDRFADELAPENGWEFDDGLADLRWYLEGSRKGSSESVHTVDDFILAIADAEAISNRADQVMGD